MQESRGKNRCFFMLCQQNYTLLSDRIHIVFRIPGGGLLCLLLPNTTREPLSWPRLSWLHGQHSRLLSSLAYSTAYVYQWRHHRRHWTPCSHPTHHVRANNTLVEAHASGLRQPFSRLIWCKSNWALPVLTFLMRHGYTGCSTKRLFETWL